MKKLLIAVPFVASASWAGTTLYSGTQTRTAHDELVAQLDGLSVLNVTTESYSSGFTRSHAITKVRLSDAADADVLFRLRHDISHTPLGLVDGGTRVGAARIVTTLLTDGLSDEAREVLAHFEGDSPIVLESDVGFDRRVSNALVVAPFTYAGSDGRADFAGLRYDFDVDPAGGVSGTGAFAGFSITNSAEGIDVRFAPGTDRFDYERIAKRVYTGEQHLALGTVTVENATTGASMTFDDATVDMRSSLRDERIETAMAVAVGRIESPLPLDSLTFDTRVGGLDVAGVERYIDGVGELLALDPGTLAPGKLLERLPPLYAELVVPGTSLDYDVAVSNAGGNATASAGLVFEGDGSPSGHDAMATIGDLVRALKLSATLDADVGAVAMTSAAMFLADDALAPWIVSDGASYRSELRLDDLIVDVNGMPMSLELMLGEALATPLNVTRD